MAGPAIRLTGVSKLYRRRDRGAGWGSLKSALVSARPGRAGGGAVPALTDVSFAIAPGEVVGVIGANGSGKSTLLRLLAGVHRPTRGTVEVSGRVAALLELGAGFHPEISGRENVEIAGLLAGLSRRQIRERFDAIVAFAELGEVLDAPVKTYSSGMTVRLGFAIAAHTDASIYLVDEVLAVGDEAFQRRSLEKFAELERDGATIVLVSHDLGLVAGRCRRALWLDGGTLAADGSAGETVARYRESVAAREASRRGPAGTPPPGARVGSGAVRVTAARLRDASGDETRRLPASRAASIELELEAPARVEDLVYGVAISTVAGVTVLATNTKLDGVILPPLAGGALASLDIPSLDLSPGVYSLDVAAHASDGTPYDYWRDALRFEVTAAGAGAGLWSPPRTWRIVPAGSGR
jgi:ABC-type polysaccharide/polyol phosphate transport system ATPase subunit